MASPSAAAAAARVVAVAQRGHHLPTARTMPAVETRTVAVWGTEHELRIVDGVAEFPEAMTIVPDRAFLDWDGKDMGCKSLLSVTFPPSVAMICDAAFENCTSLQSITFPSTDTQFWIGNTAFHKCSSLKSVIIPSSVTLVGYSAFANCTSLESVTFESTATEVSESAFDECWKLRSPYGPFVCETDPLRTPRPPQDPPDKWDKIYFKDTD